MELSVSQVFSTTIEMVKTRFGVLLGMWGVFFVLQIVLFGLFGLGFGATAMAGLGAAANPEAMGAGMILTLLVFYVVYFLVYCAQSCAMSSLASPLIEPDFGGSFSTGMRGALPLLGSFIILLIVYFVGGLVLGVVGGLLAALAGEAGSAIILILFIPVILYFVCRLSILSPVVAVDKVFNSITAISRTWKLTGGNVLKILAVMFLFAVIAIVLFGLLFLVFSGSIAALGETAGAAPAFGAIIPMLLVFFVVSALFSIFAAALIAALHAQLTDSNESSLEATFE